MKKGIGRKREEGTCVLNVDVEAEQRRDEVLEDHGVALHEVSNRGGDG